MYICIFAENIREMQIKDICIKSYDEKGTETGVFYAEYNSRSVPLSESRYNDIRPRIAKDINSFCEKIRKIFVWDMVTAMLLKDILSVKNNCLRYAESVQKSVNGDSLNAVCSSLEIDCGDLYSEKSPVSKIMCGVLSRITLKLIEQDKLIAENKNGCVPIAQCTSGRKMTKVQQLAQRYGGQFSYSSYDEKKPASHNEKKIDTDKIIAEYRLNAVKTERIVTAVSCEINQHYSNFKRFLKGFKASTITMGVITEELYKEFTEAVEKAAHINEHKVNKLIRKSKAINSASLDMLVRSAIIDECLKDGLIRNISKVTLREKYAVSDHPHVETVRISSILERKFNHESIMNIIRANTKYERYVTFMKNELSVAKASRELIIKEIPENPVDAYPLARSQKRHFVLHIGPTNSGKTYVALQKLKKAINGVYLAPLRLLAYEVFEKLNGENIPCDMLTGEEEILIPNASHVSSTVEMLDLNKYYDVAVIDECQMISDWQRGGAWTEAILGVVAGEIHLCASPDAESLLIKLIEMCGDTYEIEYHERFTPLKADDEEFTYPESVRKNDALIVFSRVSVMKYAEDLKSRGIKASVIYGNLPYDVRQNEVRRFINGETDVIVSTDAIGMGLNLPVERIVFLETYKYDGRSRRPLRQSELLQIAGRAGRRGLYETGYYNSAENMSAVKHIMELPRTDINRVVLRFPENLITVEMPLSQILSQWCSIPDEKPFHKSDIWARIQLCRDLERYTNDKRLIFRFINIPFNSNKSDLYFFWLALFEKKLNVERVSSDILRFSEDTALERLETKHQQCDILYHFFRNSGQKAEMLEVMERKNHISELIMERLVEKSEIKVG